MQILDKLSLRYLIVANSLILITFLIICSAYALLSMRQIAHELESISKIDIPLTANTTRISEHQLQQAIHFERAVRYGEQIYAGDFSVEEKLEKEIKEYQKYDSLVNEELVATEKEVQNAILSAHTEEQKAEFTKVLSVLKSIEEEHYRFAALGNQAIEHLKRVDLDLLHAMSDEIITVEDGLNHHLEELVAELSGFTLQAATTADRHEKDAFFVMLSTVSVSIILGLLMSFYIIRVIWNQIGSEPKYLNELAQRIASGDLSMDIPDVNKQVGIYASIGVMLSSLKSLIANIKQGGDSVAHSSHDLSVVSEQTRSNINNQHNSTEQVAAAITEMSSAVEEVAKNTTMASIAAMDAKEQMDEGFNMVQQSAVAIDELAKELDDTVSVMRDLEEDTKEITGILDVIKGIAEQTNLLALNAAIEAARAGDQGRGFAVVADEVRTLALSTQQSTSAIEVMITKLQTSANSSAQAIRSGYEKAGTVASESQNIADALEKARTMVDQISDMNAQIATAAEEQKVVALDISENAELISNMSQETGVGAGQLTNTSDELAKLALSLKQNISHFKLSV